MAPLARPSVGPFAASPGVGRQGAEVVIRRLFSLAVFFACLAQPAVSATSAADIGPLAHVNKVSIQVLVGDALEVAPQTATPLFAGDHRSASELREAVGKRVTELLTAGGLEVSASSRTVLDVSIFGGKFSESSTNVFLLEFSVCREGEGGCSPWGRALGTTDDERLREVLIEAVASVTLESVEKRTRFLASPP